MKKLLGIVVLGLLLSGNAYATNSRIKNFNNWSIKNGYSEYVGAKPDWSKCSGDKTASFDYIPLFCYGKDGKLLSENERKIIDKEWKKNKTGLVSYLLFEDNKIKIDEHDLPSYIKNNRGLLPSACQSLVNLVLTGEHLIKEPILSFVFPLPVYDILDECEGLIDDKEYFLKIEKKGNDRYKLMLDNPEYFYPDGVHPNRKAYKILFNHLKESNII